MSNNTKPIHILKAGVIETFKNEGKTIQILLPLKSKKDEAIVLVLTEEKVHFARYKKDLETKYIITEEFPISDIQEVKMDYFFIKTNVLLEMKNKTIELKLMKKGKQFADILHHKHNIPFSVVKRKFHNKILGFRKRIH